MAGEAEKSTEPSLEQWRELYQAAKDFRDLAPWQWMSEAHIFGIVTPDAPEPGYCSIQGALGEHFALSVYRSARGLAGLGAVRRMKEPSLDILVVTDMLMASFEDRDYLEQRDRNLIKELGLSFRGPKTWPLFRSYTPRYAPWYLTASEAGFLTNSLQQAVGIAKEVRRNPSFLLAPKRNQTLLQTKHKNNKWRNSWQTHPTVPPRQAANIAPQPPDQQLLEELQQYDTCPLNIEVDIFPSLNLGLVADKKGQRPLVPYLMLAAESQSGFVIGQHLARYEEMYSHLPDIMGRILLDSPMQIPHQLLVKQENIAENLRPLTNPLNIKIKKISHLPAVSEAKQSLNHFTSRHDDVQ